MKYDLIPSAASFVVDRDVRPERGRKVWFKGQQTINVEIFWKSVRRNISRKI
jgi:hypothetical protein